MADFFQLINLPIQALDLVVIVILLISALFAYMRGFVHEILSVAGWIGAILLTFYGLPFIRPYAQNIFNAETKSSTFGLAIDFGVGIAIFVLTLVFLSLITRSISKSVQNSLLNSLDRALGFLFGLVRGAFLVCIIFIGLDIFIEEKDRPNWLTSAKSLDLVVPGAELIRSIVPDFSENNSMIDATQKAKRKSKELLDARSAVKKLISPEPVGKKNIFKGSYGKKERQDMERLIDANQPKTSKN